MKCFMFVLVFLTYSAFSPAAEVETDCLAMNELSRVKDLTISSSTVAKQVKGQGKSQ